MGCSGGVVPPLQIFFGLIRSAITGNGGIATRGQRQAAWFPPSVPLCACSAVPHRQVQSPRRPGPRIGECERQSCNILEMFYFFPDQ